MVSKVSRAEVRAKKHRRMRHHIVGTAERPRLAVFRHRFSPVICPSFFHNPKYPEDPY